MAQVRLRHYLRGRRRLSLRHLSGSEHPLMMQGNFSIYFDPRVRHTTSVVASYDLDGVCLATR